MSIIQPLVAHVLLCVSTLLIPSPLSPAVNDWLPVTPEELNMTSELKAPGATAIYLYRQVDRDDQHGRELTYIRIKILTPKGLAYANVEIPFWKEQSKVNDIRARTVRPDGTIAIFDGQVYEKVIVKAKGLKFLAKTFTLPDVQVGSIVEYRYTRSIEPGYLFDSQWLLSEDLFTKRAKFSLLQNRGLNLQCSWPGGLPPGTNPPVLDHDMYRMETQDVPAFQIEDYMPPQEELKYHVNFVYSRNAEKDPDKFWQGYGQRSFNGVFYFVDKKKEMERAVSEIVSPGDTPNQKIEKIYARCQEILNTDFEPNKTEQEHKRDKLKDIHNVEDVWKRGYGNSAEINWLFLALVRAAGLDARPVLLAKRERHFFHPGLMNAADLDSNVVLVRLDGQDLYMNPGIQFAPPGVLPWYETGVKGLHLQPNGGTWVMTAMPWPADSGVERKAILRLDDSGILDGTVTLTFKGLSALSRRLDEKDEDDAARKKFLEDELKEYVPSAIEADLTNVPDWTSSHNTLVAVFHLRMSNWTSVAGHHTVFPVGLFGGTEKHLFEHAERVHPIYFYHPYQDTDDITIELPKGWNVAGTPKPQDVDVSLCQYHSEAQNRDTSLHLSRQLTVNIQFVDAKYYGVLRDFYQTVRSGDNAQVVLSSSSTAQH